MLGLSRSVTLAGLAVACCLGATSEAAAIGRVIGPLHQAPVVERADLVVSLGATRHTYWLSATLVGEGRFAWVLPVRPGTRLDAVGTGFIDALEHATATRVAPPPSTPACGSVTSLAIESTAFPGPYAPRVYPTQVSVVEELSALQAVAADHGLALTLEDVQRLAPLDDAHHFVLIQFELTTPRMRTEGLRLTVPGPLDAVPLALPASTQALDSVTHVISGQRSRLPGDELTPTDLEPTWLAAKGKSDYTTLRDEWLGEAPGSRFVVETSGSTPLFQWTLLPGQNSAIPPALHGYFATAQATGQTSSGPDACLISVWDAREAGKLGALVSRFCSPGSLTSVPGPQPECDASPGPGQYDADELSCGSADDVAAAFSEHDAATVRVTRHVGRLTSGSPATAQLTEAGSASVSVLSTAPTADVTGCSTGTGGASGGPIGGGGSQGGSGAPPYSPPPAEPIYQDSGSHTDIGIFCGGSSESPGACSGDSSSSGDDACSGDSSSSGGDSCSGDSSSSGGDSCSGDSSSSGGDSCSGDSSGGGDASCSGDSGGSGCSSGSGSGGDCRIGWGSGRCPRAPVLVFSLTLLGFVARRWRRQRPVF